MAFWWVNHGQTYRTEIQEGYIWSPFTNSNGGRNESYLNLDRATVNDLVFSHGDGRINAVGVVAKKAVVSPKPEAYRKPGNQWSQEGWLVEIKWTTLGRPLVPKQHLDEIVPLLPPKYAPIKADGNGNLGNYLAAISDQLGETLLRLIAVENGMANSYLFDAQHEVQEEYEIEEITRKPNSPTHRTALIEARNGQGAFKRDVERIEKQCRLTGVSDRAFLIASHIKPWKDSTDEEKLDGHNGLLLAPHVDKLFDGGYITFTDAGDILTAHPLVNDTMSRWGLDFNRNVGKFTEKQKQYLRYHREDVFEKRKEKLAQAQPTSVLYQ